MGVRHSRLTKYEARGEPLASPWLVIRRVVVNLAAAGVLVGVSLAAGMAGYAHYAAMGTVDAFVNAAMILSGMGPLSQMPNDAGKIFAGLYALYSGLVLVVCAGLVLAPIAHRILHHFHIGDDA